MAESLSHDNSPVIPQLLEVRETVLRHFPLLWAAVEAGLSACATLLLSNNSNPCALIYVGPSSAGKSTVISMFDNPSQNDGLCYRSDKFTPASFVSQSANVPKSELGKIDLLPRIRHKVLLTPELSTIFRGKPDELSERFSMITRVLDGQGLMTDSGTHGQRGYKGDYLFSWLGATTPFASVVWNVMAQLGSRLFFYSLDSVAETTVEELIDSNSNAVSYKSGLEICQQAVNAFLPSLFTKNKGVRGVQLDRTRDPVHVLRIVASCARLLALMRTPRQMQGPPSPESPHRANAVLCNLARGHALVYGRTYLTHDDLPLVARITLSSMPSERRALLLALLENPQCLTVSQAAAALGLAKNKAETAKGTAETRMEEFEWLGVANYNRQGTGKVSFLTLAPKWSWCANETFRALVWGQT
jgi:hypothetical protein